MCLPRLTSSVSFIRGSNGIDYLKNYTFIYARWLIPGIFSTVPTNDAYYSNSYE